KQPQRSTLTVLNSVAIRQLIAGFLALIIFLQPLAALRVGANELPRLAKSSASPAPANEPAHHNTVADLEAPGVPITPQSSSFGVELTAINTAFNTLAGIDYHERTRKVVVAANSTQGQPNNFDLIQADGAHTSFSNISGVTGELKIATARDDGLGLSLG